MNLSILFAGKAPIQDLLSNAEFYEVIEQQFGEIVPTELSSATSLIEKSLTKFHFEFYQFLTEFRSGQLLSQHFSSVHINSNENHTVLPQEDSNILETWL